MAPFDGKHDILGRTPSQAGHQPVSEQVTQPGEAVLSAHPVFGRDPGRCPHPAAAGVECLTQPPLEGLV